MNRLFLAIPVQLYNYGHIKEDFSPLLEGRWREEKTLHITIAFLGAHFDAHDLIEKLSSFEWSFELSELSHFDYFTKSRVFVTTTPNASLQHLYEQLATVLGLEDIELHPHVTLMRVKNILNSSAFFSLLETPFSEPIGVLEPKVVLFKSHLYPSGAEYEILKEWKLTEGIKPSKNRVEFQKQ